MSSKNRLLGLDDGHVIYLRSPSWDCSWYVGFGYVGNNLMHSHLEYFLNEHSPNKNMFDQMREVFKDSLMEELKDDSTLWKFCELFKSWTTLKEAYEFYNRGGSHYTHMPELELKSFAMAERTLRDLFKVVNELCKLINLNGLEYTKEIQKDLYMNMNPTTFTQRQTTKNDDRKWTLVYINIYDNPLNHKDKVLPKSVKAKWLKEKNSSINFDKVNHSTLSNLFKEGK